jgi:hypothetical protein
MKRLVLQFVLAVAITGPVFVALTSIDPLLAWIYGDTGWTLLTPLFQRYGVVGIEGEDEVIAGLLILCSFGLAICLVWFVPHLFNYRHAKHTPP